MKILFIIFLIVSSSFGSLIGDFAPTKVGTTWEYSYHYYYSSMGDVDNSWLTIKIELLSKQMSGKDTLVLLNVNEQGIYSFGPGGYDTTHIDSIFTDTAIISNDSIYKQAGYRCPVFPFWKSHSIDSNSFSKHSNPVFDTLLRKGISGLDTLFFATGPIPGTPFGGFIYIQGIGLDSMWFQSFSMNTMETKINLIRYNNKEISLVTPVVSKFPSKSASGNKASLFNTSKTLVLKNGTKLSRDAFLVNGKRAMARQIVPNEAVIINKSEPVNVKNR